MLSYLEQLNNYENALEAISFMEAMCAASIYEEEARPSPDAAKIERLMQQMKDYHRERMALDPDDCDAVMQVMTKYTPIIKGFFDAPRGTGVDA